MNKRKRRSLRILHWVVSISPEFGGPAKSTFELCKEQVRQGHQVCLYTSDLWGNQGLRTDKENVVQGIRITCFKTAEPRFWAYCPGLRRAFMKKVNDIDIAHLHQMYYYGNYVIAKICRHRNVPYVLQPKGCMDEYVWKKKRFKKQIAELLYENKTIQGSSRVVFSSEKEQKEGKARVRGIGCNIVPHGLGSQGLDDEGFFFLEHKGHQNFDSIEIKGKIKAFRTKHNIGDRKIILHLGRYAEKKGLDEVADAYKQVLEERDDIRLVTAGSDHGYKSKFLRKLRKLRIIDRCVVLDIQKGFDKYILLKSAIFSVMLSKTENFGIAAAESVAAGIPVLLSKNVGIAKDIVKANAGMVVDIDGAAKVVSEAMQHLADNDELRLKMSKNGISLAKKRYRWDLSAKKLEKIYMECISSKNDKQN